MKFSIHLLSLVLVVLSLQAQDNQLDAKGQKQGFWSKKYPNGKLKYEGTFKNDQPVGLMKHYFENGTIKTIAYHNGSSTSVQNFDSKGALIHTGKFYLKERDSIWTYYQYFDHQPKVLSKEYYNKGIKIGTWQTFNEDSVVVEETPYKNGKINGQRKHYYTNGKLAAYWTFINDKIEGPFEAFYPDGKPKRKGRYNNNMKDGKWLSFDEKGQFKKEEVFIKGISNKPDVLKPEEVQEDASVIDITKPNQEQPERGRY